MRSSIAALAFLAASAFRPVLADAPAKEAKPNKASAAPAAAPLLDTLPLDQIRPGMVGVGRTVFQGTAIEEFKVTVIGVLENVGPKQSMVIARLEGGPLEKT